MLDFEVAPPAEPDTAASDTTNSGNILRLASAATISTARDLWQAARLFRPLRATSSSSAAG